MEPTGAQANRRGTLFAHAVPARYAASADALDLPHTVHVSSASLKRCADGVGNERLWAPIEASDLRIATTDRR
jgi:hypothetical protein